MRKANQSMASAAVTALGLLIAGAALAGAPPQGVPSAILVYPLIQVEGGGGTVDTRVELVNLTKRAVELKCVYVTSASCYGMDFYVRLTANQPLSWLASQGSRGSINSNAVPPFSSSGELKCIVVPDPDDESVDAYNTVQGRAAVIGSDGQTIGFGAVGFVRLSDGPLGNELNLDGVEYAQCPDRQHFVFLASPNLPDPMADSEIVLAPCAEDLENLITTLVTVQFAIYNEFEQRLSASTSLRCAVRTTLRKLGNVFTLAGLGTPTGHLEVRGVQSPVLALVVDRFTTPAQVTAGNEPALDGGRSAVIRIP